MQFTIKQLNAVAEAISAEIITSDDPEEGPFLALIAGAGEIHLDTQGNAWYFEWDRTHAVSKEKELDLPDTDDPREIAWWLNQEAAKFDSASF